MPNAAWNFPVPMVNRVAANIVCMSELITTFAKLRYKDEKYGILVSLGHKFRWLLCKPVLAYNTLILIIVHFSYCYHRMEEYHKWYERKMSVSSCCDDNSVYVTNTTCRSIILWLEKKLLLSSRSPPRQRLSPPCQTQRRMTLSQMDHAPRGPVLLTS